MAVRSPFGGGLLPSLRALPDRALLVNHRPVLLRGTGMQADFRPFPAEPSNEVLQMPCAPEAQARLELLFLFACVGTGSAYSVSATG